MLHLALDPTTGRYSIPPEILGSLQIGPNQLDLPGTVVIAASAANWIGGITFEPLNLPKYTLDGLLELKNIGKISQHINRQVKKTEKKISVINYLSNNGKEYNILTAQTATNLINIEKWRNQAPKSWEQLITYVINCLKLNLKQDQPAKLPAGIPHKIFERLCKQSKRSFEDHMYGPRETETNLCILSREITENGLELLRPIIGDLYYILQRVKPSISMGIDILRPGKEAYRILSNLGPDKHASEILEGLEILKGRIPFGRPSRTLQEWSLGIKPCFKSKTLKVELINWLIKPVEIPTPVIIKDIKMSKYIASDEAMEAIPKLYSGIEADLLLQQVTRVPPELQPIYIRKYYQLTTGHLIPDSNLRYLLRDKPKGFKKKKAQAFRESYNGS